MITKLYFHIKFVSVRVNVSVNFYDLLQVSNPDTDLLFYSESEEEVHQWIALVQEAIR